MRNWFRIVATAEALSWAGLLIGMAFKYVLSDNEIGVQIFGPIHGGVFVAYVATVLVVFRRFGWSRSVTSIALAASIPPFTTLLFERWADRTGRLGDPAPTAPGSPHPSDRDTHSRESSGSASGTSPYPMP